MSKKAYLVRKVDEVPKERNTCGFRKRLTTKEHFEEVRPPPPSSPSATAKAKIACGFTDQELETELSCLDDVISLLRPIEGLELKLESYQEHLCPGNPEAREHALNFAVDLVKGYGLGGLKVDHIDSVPLDPCRSDHRHDLQAAGPAIAGWLADLRRRLEDLVDQSLIEYRLSYANVNNRSFGNLYRAFDVNWDFDENRFKCFYREHMEVLIRGSFRPADLRPGYSTSVIEGKVLVTFDQHPSPVVRLSGSPQELYLFNCTNWDCLVCRLEGLFEGTVYDRDFRSKGKVSLQSSEGKALVDIDVPQGGFVRLLRV